MMNPDKYGVETLETSSGRAAIMPWHIGIHAVLEIGGSTNIRLDGDGLGVFQHAIINKHSGQLGITHTHDYQGDGGYSVTWDTNFVFSWGRFGKLTIATGNGSQATLTSYGITRLLANFDMLQMREVKEKKQQDEIDCKKTIGEYFYADDESDEVE